MDSQLDSNKESKVLGCDNKNITASGGGTIKEADQKVPCSDTSKNIELVKDSGNK